MRCNRIVLTLLAGFAAFCPTAGYAHGTVYQVLDTAATITAEFGYTDGQPMPFAEVLIFSPQDTEVEHQNGRTDRHGRFAFRPDVPGTWRVKVDDGTGHRVDARIEVAADLTTATPLDRHAHHHGSVWLKTVAGLSLLANLFLFAMLRARSSKAESG